MYLGLNVCNHRAARPLAQLRCIALLDFTILRSHRVNAVFKDR